MGKTILELDTSEASITDDSVYYIATQKSSDTKAKKTVLTKIVTYLKGVFQSKVNTDNVATGTTEVTINATSGVATFTEPIASTTRQLFIINNNKIEDGDVLDISLSGDFGSTDGIIQLIGYKCGVGVIDIYVYNNSSSDTFDVPVNIVFSKAN